MTSEPNREDEEDLPEDLVSRLDPEIEEEDVEEEALRLVAGGLGSRAE